MKDAFLAVLTIDAADGKSWVVFSFKGDTANAEKIETSWRAKLLGTAPDLKQETMITKGIRSRLRPQASFVFLPSATVNGSFSRTIPNN